jgi:thiol-disulfide isomerase/thioredoxin
MKKILQLVAVTSIFFISELKAQIPDGNFFTHDLVITDLSESQHRLYDYLNDGKPLIIDLFAEWCGPCWNYHNPNTSHPNAGALKKFYEEYGPDGTDEAMVIAIESDPNTDVSTLFGGNGTNGWDWVTGTPYPMANQNVNSPFQLAFYPTIYMLCPNRQIYLIGQPSASAIYELTQNCLSATEGTNAAVIRFEGNPNLTCGGGETNHSFLIQNLGSEDLTDLKLVVSDESGEIVVEDSWSGDMKTYDFTTISLGTSFFSENSNLTLTISDLSGDVEYGKFDYSVNVPTDVKETIEVHFHTDFYPGETSWELRNGSNQVVFSFGPYRAGTADNFGGGGPDAVTTIIHEVEVDNVDDCYHMVVKDSYGDGLGYGVNPAGKYGFDIYYNDEKIVDVALGDFGSTFNSEDLYTSSMSSNVTDLNLYTTMSIFPNPVVETANIELNLEREEKLSIEIYDIHGRLLNMLSSSRIFPAGKHNFIWNPETSGTYIIMARGTTGIMTQKIMVGK